MKLTKKNEAEILKIYEEYWRSYLAGDLRTLAGFLTDDFKLIGTTEGEVFQSKKTALKYLKSTIHQIAGILIRKNSRIKLATIGETVVVDEQFDGYVNVKGQEAFYSIVRLTSIFKYIRGKWLIAHQHGSVPDPNTEAGETLAADRIEKENRELKDAVRRHTKDLEDKNRELEIEASLERVRARAMAMQSSNELGDLIGLIYTELTRLDKTLHVCIIKLFDESTGDSTWWMASREMSSPKRGYLVPHSNHRIHLGYLAAWKRRDVAWRYVLKGTEKKKWDDYIFSKTEIGLLPKALKSKMRARKVVHVAASFNKYGCMQTGAGDLLPPGSMRLLERFSAMFEQTYTRFLDLKNAEAQTRESQIQLALERVRARTMAMQKGDELKEVASLLFSQIKDLGITCWTTGFNVWSDDGDSYEDFVTNPTGGFMDPYIIDTTRFDLLREVSVARNRGDTFYVRFETGEEIKKTYEFLQQAADKNQFQKILDSGTPFPTQQVNHFVFGSKVSLLFITYDHVPEAHDIFKRFGKAFEQTYTRFLDLKKAEAQARESQIQLALERVRARTMAMQKSEELSEVAILLFSQVSQLGIKAWTTGFNVWSDDNNFYTDYVASPQGNLIKAYTIDAREFPVFVAVAEAKKRGEEFWISSLDGDLIKETYKELDKYGTEKQYDKMLEDGSEFPSQQYNHFVFGSQVSLMFITYEPVPEAHDIFKRFGKVFQQTYTRFLDLQKAESQAREAQIEAALEKVRSTSLAMHHSDELEKVVAVLLEKLVDLGLHFDGVGLNIFDKEKRGFDVWVASKLLPAAAKFSMPYDAEMAKNAIIKDLWRTLETGEHIFNKAYSGKEKNDYFAYVAKQNEFKAPKEVAKHNLEAKSWTATFTAEKNSIIVFDSWTGQTTSDEDFEVLKRFSRVFEQAYVRFLDLQKAEAQAREAQIEAALERVRSRTMAMHKSEELLEVITVVCEQVQHVGIKFSSVSFGKNSGTFDMDFWGAAPDLKTPIRLYAPYKDITIYQRLKAAHKEGKTFFTDTFTADETRVWYEHLISHNLSMFNQKSREYLVSRPAMTRTTVLLKNVFLFAINHSIVNYSNEENEILIRFANVFEQAYTRFLDLQKAEAQAHEAQVEAALEKVRARTMGMQRSDELADVAVLMFQQVRSFGLESWGCGFNIWEKDQNECTGWMTSPTGGLVPPLPIPLTEHPLFIRFYESRQTGQDFWVQEMEGQELEGLYSYMETLPILGDVLREVRKRGIQQPTHQFNHVVNFAQGNLIFITYEPCPGAHDIFKRFAKVFEQTYTRFLDLKKAEAQAREAQIEAALEKIRSRSLAMHQSAELKHVVAIMFEKLKELKVVLGTVAIQLFDATTMNSRFWAGNSLHEEPPMANLPYDETRMKQDSYMKDAWDMKMKGENLINKEYSTDQKRMFFDYVFAHNDLTTIPEGDRKVMTDLIISQDKPYVVCLINEKNSSLFADSWDGTLYGEESIKVLARAAKVFEQAYVRFLDLQKAEAQARESQIEAALERVRARAMAMHTARELNDVVHELRRQIGMLGQKDLDTCVIWLHDESTDFIQAWAAMLPPGGDGEMHEFSAPVPKRGLMIIEESLKAYEDGKQDYVLLNEKDKLKQWVEFMAGILPGAHQLIIESIEKGNEKAYWSFSDFRGGSLLMITNDPPEESSRALLRRFTNVFGLAYRRFADLKQAEAQAREAQIEAALERVRARAMAMHTAMELNEVVHELRTQMGQLGQKDLSTCVIHLNDEFPDYVESFASLRAPETDSEILDFHVMIPKRGLKIIEETLAEYYSHRHDYVMMYEGETVKQWNAFVRKVAPAATDVVESTVYYEAEDTLRGYWACADFQGGTMLFATSDPPEEESRALLRRFANVFGLAYRRFSDLKKAEAQAREATIEAALEKIRSRSLGMHNSGEIKDVVVILFEKLKELGLVFDGGAAIHLFKEDSRDSLFYVAAPELNGAVCCNQPYDELAFIDNPIILDVRSAKENGVSIVNKQYSFEEKNKFFDYIFKHNEFARTDVPLNAKSYTVTLIAEKNCLLGANSWTEQQFSESDVEVLKRVTHVFEQAYIRFIDLQKSEAQAREATIEAALEKIRSRSLGMQKSEEINDVVAILFEKLKELGLTFDGGASIHTFSSGTKDMSIWVTTDGAEPVHNRLPYDEEYLDSPIMQDLVRAAETGEHIINRRYTREQKNRYFEYVSKHNDASRVPEEVRRSIMDADSFTVTQVAERNCLLGADSRTGQTFSEHDIDIFKRAARVFDQAYVRFLDLQKAEVHAKDAVRQASLDRVRAEIASMRTVKDLDRITPLIWRELNSLAIPFIRCGVFIMDDNTETIHTFLATPDGNAIAVFDLPYSSPGVIASILEHWQQKKMYGDHWDERALMGLGKILVDRNVFGSIEQYLSTLPSEGFYPYCMPFQQGMLYVGNLTPLKDDELSVLQSLADAFSTAYARYDDFNKLEEAKQQVDDALVELKQTQQQLVQSEKMASLGELTAGIAHEIQNPLNFVNNFSEVSHELIDEMKAEIEAGNVQAATELVENIKQNLEKITHHGKRADGIVKGMLQHSRTGSGQKEQTDINVLCDEYLRLAYHGYRAKDKSFKANFETSFDSALPRISVVPQDIGRVILNLINNAFYAVSEKSKVQPEVYAPKVTVSTRKLDDRIEVRVGDNGPGIPESIKEKVFQPFFTTKPTGQGTGLGLSLAYDIVTKLHGGELKLETKPGEGSEFIIVIPCARGLY